MKRNDVIIKNLQYKPLTFFVSLLALVPLLLSSRPLFFSESIYSSMCTSSSLLSGTVKTSFVKSSNFLT